MALTQLEQQFLNQAAFVGDNGERLLEYLDRGVNPAIEDSIALDLLARASGTCETKVKLAERLMSAGADIKQCPGALLSALFQGRSTTSLALYYIEEGADVHFMENLAFAGAIVEKEWGVLMRLAQHAREPVNVSPYVAMYLDDIDDDEQRLGMLEEITNHSNLIVDDEVVERFASPDAHAWYLSEKLKSDAPVQRRAVNSML